MVYLRGAMARDNTWWAISDAASGLLRERIDVRIESRYAVSASSLITAGSS
jgi:hypothetical protein